MCQRCHCASHNLLLRLKLFPHWPLSVSYPKGLCSALGNASVLLHQLSWPCWPAPPQQESLRHCINWYKRSQLEKITQSKMVKFSVLSQQWLLDDNLGCRISRWSCWTWRDHQNMLFLKGLLMENIYLCIRPHGWWDVRETHAFSCQSGAG